MNERIKDFVEGSIGYLAAALVAIVYVATGLLVPGVNDKTLVDILREGAVSFALGVALNLCLNLQGILKGKRSPKMEQTVNAHGKAVEAIEPYIHRLDGWCNEQNAMALRRERTRILTAVCMRYEDCFDEDGVPREVDLSGLPEEVREKREAAMKAAISLTLTPISAASLTGEGSRAGDPFYFGETVDEYERRTNLKDAVSKLVIAAGFGYFSVDMVLNFDVGQLIWRVLYVALLLALGVSKLLRSYLFMVDTYRGNIVKRLNYLQSFKNWASETPEGEEKNGNDHSIHTGSVQNRSGEGAGAQERGGEGTGGREHPKTAEIPAARGALVGARVQPRAFGDRPY